jgi:CheY-like chemotaxis protein
MNDRVSVLLADDDGNDVMLMRQAFERAGISNPVMVVCDGQEAICYLNGEGDYADRMKFPWPGLLVSDLKMPRMDGFDVLKWLQEPHRRKGLPVVVLSSSNTESDVAKALALGASAYRVKAPDFYELIRLAEELRESWLEPAYAGRHREWAAS